MKLTALMLPVVAIASLTLAACGSTSEPKTPSAKQGAAAGASTTTTMPPTTMPPAAALGIIRADATATSFTAGTAINLAFTLTGAEGREVIVGLFEAPKGPTLAHELSSTAVSFSWAVPVAGSNKVRFLLRDKAKCVATEAVASKCDITPADYGVIGANSAYDIVSEEFSLDVAASLSTGTLPGSTLPGSTGGLGNGALISQITGLLGGAGGNITSLLSGLGNGQLQSILASLKNGGNIGSILGMLGLGLTEE